MRVRGKSGLVCGSVGLLLAVSQGAVAQDQPTEVFSWYTELGAEKSDNIARTPTDEIDETTGIGRLGLDIETKRPRLQADIAADLEYRDYLDRDFNSEIAGGLDGVVDYAFIPERFSWVIEDNYGQIAKNRQVADRPDNREQMNFLSTGPEITIPLGARTRFEISGRYTDTYLEDSIQDNNAVIGTVSLARAFSEQTSLSLNAGASKTEFDDPLSFPDYDTRQASLELQINAPRTQLVLEGGYLEYEQDGAPDTSDYAMARIDLTRQIGARSQLRLVAGTAPASTGESFRRDQQVMGIGDGPEAAQAASDIFRSDDAYVTWSTEWQRTSLSVIFSARRETHEEFTELDREQLRGGVAMTRDISQAISVDLFGSYLQEERTESAFKFDEWSAGGSLRWDFAPRLSLQLRLDHFSGSSDDGTRDYDENRAYLGIRYTGGREKGGRNGGGY
jgi:hypothetical protein